MHCIKLLLPLFFLFLPLKGQEPSTLLSLASNPLLVSTLYAKPQNIATGIATDGAISVNALWERDLSKPWFIEEQRYGADFIQMGIVTHQPQFISQGTRILNWGFAHETNGTFSGTGDSHHSISFFLEAVSRAVITLREAQAENELTQLTHWKTNLRLAAHQLITPTILPKNHSKTMDPYTHRFFLCAAALGQSGYILDDAQLKQAAALMAHIGLSRQLSDGTNPERGGFDVNYQIVGVVFAIRYYLVCEDDITRSALKKMITQAITKELLAIDSSGNVIKEGSTRLTSEVGRNGRPKTMDYKMLVQALVYWAAINHDASLEYTAKQVAHSRNW